ncbi:tautomerase family protein [Chelatococcus asaccharovorans]|uniref:tautomerase family protein n=1 Tax=Chelatococcus asaccharovorans TaxID=28210 RepID=UPI00224C6761|nr:4-oxalocrotonate tautomerase family protein [Chelatococcus asaccharovorans]CAH1673751.1 4-oxalocrotonate tautomerase [Chelatococcus asaccharovorans]CAH1674846.1 4-oxalocrotonate tautomerase [Chelatococcus asaccharovorans]
MPVITIRIGKGRPIETKRAAARAITDAVVSTLGVRREWVTILFDEYDRENWATGGELHADKFGPGFGTAGTETGASGRGSHEQ